MGIHVSDLQMTLLSLVCKFGGGPMMYLLTCSKVNDKESGASVPVLKRTAATVSFERVRAQI